MFKRIEKSLKKLSLTKQLILILGVMASVIFLVVVPMIDANVAMIVDQQLYNSIADQQSQLMTFIQRNHEELSFRDVVDGTNDLKVSHIIYNVETNTSKIVSEDNQNEDFSLQEYIFNPKLVEMMSLNETEGSYSEVLSNGRKIYYVIMQSPYQKDNYWISYAYSDLSDGLRNDIKHELVNLMYLVILVIALVLSIWIYSMIKPLRQIQNYIYAIKHGTSFQLKMTRQDEIGEVGVALKDMEAELQRQNQLKSDLIHNISHDLKTPIAIIRSYSECLKEDIYPYGDKNSSLDVVMENADRLEKKVKDFLYLNRLDYLEGKEVADSFVDVADIASHLVNELSPLNPTLTFKVDLKETYFMGEYEHWYSALMNILDNAIRYANHVIKVTVCDDFIQVFNDGSRIEESLKKEIFEPYTKGAKGNYGLGMSIVHKIVTMYQCEISVENIEDGVVFLIKKNKRDRN